MVCIHSLYIPSTLPPSPSRQAFTMACLNPPWSPLHGIPSTVMACLPLFLTALDGVSSPLGGILLHHGPSMAAFAHRHQLSPSVSWNAFAMLSRTPGACQPSIWVQTWRPSYGMRRYSSPSLPMAVLKALYGRCSLTGDLLPVSKGPPVSE